jgi:Raf kinase inhibitor-like YbhB/YbcL family protein
MTIESMAFEDNEEIPTRYGRSFDDVNPPLSIADVPNDAISLALIMDDPDAPSGTFTHWVVYNITPEEMNIEEGETPAGAVRGVNDYGKLGYGGPIPPSGTHHYHFKLYALDSQLDLEEGSTSEDLEEAMEGHVITMAKIVGLYSAEQDK